MQAGGMIRDTTNSFQETPAGIRVAAPELGVLVALHIHRRSDRSGTHHSCAFAASQFRRSLVSNNILRDDEVGVALHVLEIVLTSSQRICPHLLRTDFLPGTHRAICDRVSQVLMFAGCPRSYRHRSGDAVHTPSCGHCSGFAGRWHHHALDGKISTTKCCRTNALVNSSGSHSRNLQ